MFVSESNPKIRNTLYEWRQHKGRRAVFILVTLLANGCGIAFIYLSFFMGQLLTRGFSFSLVLAPFSLEIVAFAFASYALVQVMTLGVIARKEARRTQLHLSLLSVTIALLGQFGSIFQNESLMFKARDPAQSNFGNLGRVVGILGLTTVALWFALVVVVAYVVRKKKVVEVEKFPAINENTYLVQASTDNED
jgi:hypothetical protein